MASQDHNELINYRFPFCVTIAPLPMKKPWIIRGNQPQQSTIRENKGISNQCATNHGLYTINVIILSFAFLWPGFRYVTVSIRLFNETSLDNLERVVAPYWLSYGWYYTVNIIQNILHRFHTVCVFCKFNKWSRLTMQQYSMVSLR